MTTTTPVRAEEATPAVAPPLLALPSGARRTPAKVLPDRTRALGTYLFMIADGVVLSTIIAAYFAVKDGSAAWPPVDVGVGTYIPFVVSVTALMATCSAQWALRSIRENDQRTTLVAIGMTVFLGVAMANAEWAAFAKAGFGVADHVYGTFYYLLFGYHLAHVVVGTGLLTLLGGRAMAGHFSAEHHDPLRAGVLYWHYSSAVWGAVATALFVFSRVNG